MTLSAIRTELGQYIRKEEAAYGKSRCPPDTLMGHLERVARHARRLALQEGLDPDLAEIAALFHDAGKFREGQYHADDKPEEDVSIDVLRDIGVRNGLGPDHIEQAAYAISQLYRDQTDPTLLTQVLFDADNLDKLGLSGIAQYFIKSGLRGKGLSADMIIRLTIELAYARYAACGLYTQSGKALAEQRSADTIRFILDFLKTLHEDGIFETRILNINVCDLDLDVIAPEHCVCGGGFELKHWTEKGIKCTEIHLEFMCNACAKRHKIRFCRPRLIR